MQTPAEVKQGLEERALVYLEQTYGGEPFTVAGVAVELAENVEPGSTANRWSAAGFIAQVASAIRAVMREHVDGHPRYLWTGAGGLYQRAEALPVESLDKLDHRGQAMVSAYVANVLMVARLKAAKSGTDEDADRVAKIAELEALLA